MRCSRVPDLHWHRMRRSTAPCDPDIDRTALCGPDTLVTGERAMDPVTPSIQYQDRDKERGLLDGRLGPDDCIRSGT